MARLAPSRPGFLVLVALFVWASCVEAQRWSAAEFSVPASTRSLEHVLSLANAVVYSDTRQWGLLKVQLNSTFRRGEAWNTSSVTQFMPLSGFPHAMALHPTDPNVMLVVCSTGVVEVNVAAWTAVNRTGSFVGVLSALSNAPTARVRQFLVEVSAFGSSASPRAVYWMTLEARDGSEDSRLVVVDPSFGPSQTPVVASLSLPGASGLVQHPTTFTIYVGAAQGRVHTFDPSNVRLSGGYPTFAVGVGRMLAAAYADNHIYWSTDLMVGLETEPTLASLELRRVVFISAPTAAPLNRVLVVSGAPSNTPERTGAIFFAGGAVLARVNRADMSSAFLVATLASPTHNISGIAVDTTSSQLFVVSRGALNSSSIHPFAMHVCDQLDCVRCSVDDPLFCDVCAKTRSCSSRYQCERYSAPVPASWGGTESLSICPRIQLSRSRGAATGGYNITISGNFAPLAAGNPPVACRFASGSTAIVSPLATRTSDSVVSCLVPDLSASVSNVEATWVVTVVVDSVAFAADSFTFYSCRLLSQCSLCGGPAYPDCHFCLLSSPNCTSATCPLISGSDQTTTLCPTLLRYAAQSPVTSRTYEYMPGEVVRISSLSVQDLILSNVPVIYGAAGNYRLSTPTVNKFAFLFEFNSTKNEFLLSFRPTAFDEPAVITASVVYDPTGTTVLSFPAASLNCSSLSVCSQCVSEAPFCEFCQSSHTCVKFNSFGSTCGNTRDYIYSFPTNCTVLQQLNQTNSFLETYQQAAVAITLNSSLTQAVGAGVECGWSANGSSFVHTPYSTISPSLLVCSTPPLGSVTDGTWSVRLRNTTSSTDTTEALPFLFYRCDSAAASSCFDCADPERPQCRWCSTGNFGTSRCLASSGSCSGGQFISDRTASCPALVGPLEDSTKGFRQLEIPVQNAADLAAVPSVVCQFSFGSFQVNSSAIVSAPNVTCISPPFNATGLGQVRLLTPSRRYTGNTAISIYDCASLSDCVSCSQRSACTWCVGRCEAKSICSPMQATACPQILSIMPNQSETAGQEIVIVSGSGFSTDSAVNYFCRFGAVSVPALSSTTTSLTCVSPASSKGVVSVSVEFSVGGAPAVPFSPTRFDFEYFSCPRQPLESSCNANCTADPRCGWCVHLGACSSAGRCSALWEQPCISVVSKVAHAAVDGGYAVSMALSSNLTAGIQYNSSTEALRCHFGSLTPLVAQVSDSLSTISCVSPSVVATQQVALEVRYRGSEFFSYQFDFVNCSQYSSCSSCSRSSYCGWCLQDNQCSTEAQCKRSSDSKLFALGECPSLREVSPASGSFAGGEQVALLGARFIPTADLSSSVLTVKFGMADATLVSVTNGSILVTAPSAASAGVSGSSALVNVSIFWNRNTMYTDSLRYSYVEAAGVLSTGTAFDFALGVVVNTAGSLRRCNRRHCRGNYCCSAAGSCFGDLLCCPLPKDERSCCERRRAGLHEGCFRSGFES